MRIRGACAAPYSGHKATACIIFAKVHLKKYIYYQLIFIDYQYIYIIFASQF